jgi:hypothetical protein
MSARPSCASRTPAAATGHCARASADTFTSGISRLARRTPVAATQLSGVAQAGADDMKREPRSPSRRSTVEAEEDNNDGGTVELVIGDVTVRVGPDVSSSRIMEIVRAIRAA